ncbi:hypothetical protein V9L05_20210 [Bernardetia sp. Wsw4-3y2]|uniref:hypothetical protein n=1 Tax=unclassified Bernardetia TaxID=2647129 RepID=UPI0030D573FB
MKNQVSKNIYYTLEVDYSKNRVYLSILQKWNDEDDFCHFFEEWHEIINKITVDFTIICDFRLMPILSRQMVKVFENMQEYVSRNGLCHIAEIVAENDISNLQMARIAQHSGVPISRFETYELADRFLDKFLDECR